MKLFLVLFALLTGFGGADAPASRPAAPASLGAVVQIAQAIVHRAAATSGLRVEQPLPSLAEVSDCPEPAVTVTMAQLALPTRADRARE
ncbi:MAG: hypothetical protein RLZZ58_1981 [Pseudomonadota bacterium]